MGKHVAVDDLTLTVEPGKSMVFFYLTAWKIQDKMNMITGYPGATSGEAKINGHDILPIRRRQKNAWYFAGDTPVRR